MKAISLLIFLVLILLVLLIAESVIIGRRLKRIPLRITVSGTRGKTWVTRALASVLRESGMSVLAKTTGSEAALILPGGEEVAIKRRGMVSITEQKRTVARAVKENAECLITEVMSIREENRSVESSMLIKPHITIFTNFRADHLDAFGESHEEIVKQFCSDIFPRSELIVNEEEVTATLTKEAEKRGAVISISTAGPEGLPAESAKLPRFIPEENVRLVCCAARKMGISDDVIVRGITGMKYDIGETAIFRINSNGKEVLFVNSFAANEPLSTTIMIERVIRECELEDFTVAGLLALREDRAERTWQWCRYLSDSGREKFPQLFVTGRQRGIVRRKVPGAIAIAGDSPVEITNRIMEMCSDRTVVFGLANIGGTGNKLVEYWKENGEEK